MLILSQNKFSFVFSQLYSGAILEPRDRAIPKVLYLVKSTTKCKQGAARVDLPGTTPAKRAPFWPPRLRDGALVFDPVRYRILVTLLKILDTYRSVAICGYFTPSWLFLCHAWREKIAVAGWLFCGYF